jgi:hypothetical protein
MTACNNSASVVQPGESAQARLLESGKVVVHVHWDGQGLPGKRVEVVELKRVKTTNDEGLAEFFLPAGNYTLRAYEINRGGPALRYVDTDIKVTAGEEIRVEIVDCLPCV